MPRKFLKRAQTEPYDAVGAIMAYEQGDLSDHDSLVLFAHLVKTGLAWKLQGHYGRTAAALIEQGYISKSGEVLREVV
jgi:hypothetical protein